MRYLAELAWAAHAIAANRKLEWREVGANEPRPWGGDFGEYASLAGVRVPTYGEAWWDLPEGRFVCWRRHISALELIGTAA